MSSKNEDTLRNDLTMGGDEKAPNQTTSSVIVLLPILVISYMLQYLDKTTLGNAAILGLEEDTHLAGQEYSWASSIFYFGYLAASYPASICFVKFPLGKFMAVSILIWAVVLACHAATQNFAGLAVTRFFLGVFEAVISPGFSLLTGMWYKSSEHASRHAIWFSGNACALMFGSLLSYAISHIKSALNPWRWIFIIFGLVTFVWGIVLLFFLPDSPQSARFLTPHERPLAQLRPQKRQKSTKSGEYKKYQVIEALTDPKTWLLFAFTVSTTIPNGGLTNFSSIIILGFGFPLFTTLLMGMPSAGFQLIFVLTSSFLASKIRKSRCIIMACLCAISLVGCFLIRELDVSNKVGRLFGIMIFGAYAASFPLSLSLIASNVAGFTKKSTVTATMLIGYCAGNIAGPQLFFAREAPKYDSAFTGLLICFCVGFTIILVLRFVMLMENKKRDREQGVRIDPEQTVDGNASDQEEVLDQDE